uniref:Meckel syndrome type 1 protein n=1 Tax=Panagrolaimus sp. ES5 TaxID=591445 RepID=A0AC34F6L9_9BILA
MMQIMSYFGPLNDTRENYDKSDEKELCKITVTNQKEITFEPELGTRRIETRYGIYHVTIDLPDEVIFHSINKPRNFEQSDENNGNGIEEDAAAFELPDAKTIWMHYLIIIDEAIDFPHNGLYIEYKFQLPSNVKFAESSLQFSQGRTQICCMKEENTNDVAKFSYPIEITLEFMENTEPDDILKWPQLLCRVISEDYWQRTYISGYSQILLPINIGQTEYKVPCWRPANMSNNVSKMRDYFLGQPISLQALENLGIKDSAVDSSMCNVGIQSESSGVLTFKIQTIRQSRQFISKDILRSLQYGNLLAKVGLDGTLHWRIMKVLMQFEEARRQLLKLRS